MTGHKTTLFEWLLYQGFLKAYIRKAIGL